MSREQKHKDKADKKSEEAVQTALSKYNELYRRVDKALGDLESGLKREIAVRQALRSAYIQANERLEIWMRYEGCTYDTKAEKVAQESYLIEDRLDAVSRREIAAGIVSAELGRALKTAGVEDDESLTKFTQDATIVLEPRDIGCARNALQIWRKACQLQLEKNNERKKKIGDLRKGQIWREASSQLVQPEGKELKKIGDLRKGLKKLAGATACDKKRLDRATEKLKSIEAQAEEQYKKLESLKAEFEEAMADMSKLKSEILHHKVPMNAPGKCAEQRQKQERTAERHERTTANGSESSSGVRRESRGRSTF